MCPTQVVSSVLNIATALPDATLPLLETLAGRTQAMWDGGQLTYGERNILAEAMLSGEGWMARLNGSCAIK